MNFKWVYYSGYFELIFIVVSFSFASVLLRYQWSLCKIQAEWPLVAQIENCTSWSQPYMGWIIRCTYRRSIPDYLHQSVWLWLGLTRWFHGIGKVRFDSFRIIANAWDDCKIGWSIKNTTWLGWITVERNIMATNAGGQGTSKWKIECSRYLWSFVEIIGVRMVNVKKMRKEQKFGLLYWVYHKYLTNTFDQSNTATRESIKI